MNAFAATALCLAGAIVIGLTGWGLIALVRRYLDLSSAKAGLVLLLSVLTGIGAGLIRCHQKEIPSPLLHWANGSDGETMACFAAALLAAVGLVFLVKLHSKWIGGRLTDAERRTGLEGARAWLGAGNLVCVALLSLLAWLACDYSPTGVAMLGLLALLAHPGLVALAAYLRASPLPEPNATERQRVLTMLDSGKITAAECAELLNALNYTEQPRTARTAAAPQKLVLIGAALLLIGFFLPWFTINPQAELNRVAEQLPFGSNVAHAFNNAVPLNTVRISGSEVRYGLGWLVLVLGVAAAALPYLAGDMNELTRQRAILAGLGVGAILLLYLVTQNLRFVSVGLLLVTIGYALQLAGALHRGQSGAERVS